MFVRVGGRDSEPAEPLATQIVHGDGVEVYGVFNLANRPVSIDAFTIAIEVCSSVLSLLLPNLQLECSC